MKGTRREFHLDGSKVGNIQINQVISFCYLGAIVKEDNTLEEEVKERIAKGNGAYYANKPLF